MFWVCSGADILVSQKQNGGSPQLNGGLPGPELWRDSQLWSMWDGLCFRGAGM